VNQANAECVDGLFQANLLITVRELAEIAGMIVGSAGIIVLD
jgi:hypothetical protein